MDCALTCVCTVSGLRPQLCPNRARTIQGDRCKPTGSAHAEADGPQGRLSAPSLGGNPLQHPAHTPGPNTHTQAQQTPPTCSCCSAPRCHCRMLARARASCCCLQRIWQGVSKQHLRNLHAWLDKATEAANPIHCWLLHGWGRHKKESTTCMKRMYNCIDCPWTTADFAPTPSNHLPCQPSGMSPADPLLAPHLQLVMISFYAHTVVLSVSCCIGSLPCHLLASPPAMLLRLNSHRQVKPSLTLSKHWRYFSVKKM